MKKISTIVCLLLLGMVAAAQAPTANFSAAQTAGCAPVVISFQDQSTDNPTAWRWDFGNGSTSTLQNPSTVYFSPGTYTVTLTATNTNGSSTTSRSGYITIYDKPVIDFVADDSTGCAPFTTRFSDRSAAAPGTANASWQWDFGNGTSASGQTVQTTFTTSGTYTVSLRVTSDKGCYATASKDAYIKLTGGVVVDFTTTAPNRCQPPFPVSFTNNSTGPGTLTYYWDFGDNSFAAQRSPSHTYTTPGNYTVTLAVTSSTGCSDTLRRTNAVSIPDIKPSFTAPADACVRAPVSFSSTSTPAPQSSVWDFGDGSTISAANPVHVYTNPGTYTVRLQQNFGFCTDSTSRTITILPRPVVAFSAPATVSCQPPFTVRFANNSTGAATYRWDFGDGNSSTDPNPTHTYTAYGDFTVRLIATTAAGCPDTLVQDKFVRIQKPVISFPTLPLRGCVPYNASFSAVVNTPDVVTSYLWDLDNGVTSTASNPSNTYPLQGNYTVSLTITTSTGCTEKVTVPNAVVVGRVPIVNFTSAPLGTVCAFGDIRFTDQTNEADTWVWNFGDGTTSTTRNPTHQYTRPGTYAVSLTATNNGCSVTETKNNFVTVNPPVADFTFTKNCGNPLQYNFRETSTGGLTFAWDFGDGNTGTGPNPTHTYSRFGSYQVTVLATNGGCSHKKTYTVDVFNELPVFTADRRTACKTATISYSLSGANLANITAYNWDFSNGSTSTAQAPQVVYTTAGNFTTTLVVTDKYNCTNRISVPDYIRINGPTAAFTVPTPRGCAGLQAQFVDASTTDGVNAIRNWRWFYGDGNSQSFNLPTTATHTYANVGLYTPRLVITDAAGCRDSISYTDLISTSRPKADFTSADTLNCLGSTVRFSNSSAQPPFSSLWIFGDGTTSTLQDPTHVYADTGSYTVALKITDANGCTDSFPRNKYITIRQTKAAFDVSDSLAGCTPFEVKFTNRSQFYTSSLWQLGNGNSTVQDPAQVYNTAGTYTIRLQVTGRGGCTDVATRTIQVFDASATTFDYDPLSGCKPLPLTATVNSPANLSYLWDFGDGNIVTTTNAVTQHRYQVFGNYLPKLLLVDSGNCLVPLIGRDTVRIIGATAKFGVDNRFFCDSGTVLFLDSTTTNDPITSYTWDFGDGGVSSAVAPRHTYTAPGLYTVSLALQTQQNCRDTFRMDQLVKVVASPLVHIRGDSVICQNELVRWAGVFDRIDTSAVRWTWQFPNGATSALQTPLPQRFPTAGRFQIQTIAVNSSGCSDTATQNLLVNPVPVITLPSPQVTPLATPVLLPASYTNNIVQYQWTPSTGLSCTGCAQPFASPKFNTLYTVTAVDDRGCRSSASVQVIVLCQGANVFLPNTFSPNGDGSNDVFYVRGRGLERVKSLRIFNRWGQAVFEKFNFSVNDASVGWDGSFRGQKLPPDVYVYQADVFCENGESIRLDGNVSLLR